ncbi:hypothetical protein DVK85_02260 [Flavobacterium arcticum]|uniref:Uncharacterized protein n=1 Tax=Flavobacterium arcticum TaxID=1784713 RepID=A0A345H952_9FLAO|nr:hypothetical protein DVK85_02260 [Flavobacterium arcticum]
MINPINEKNNKKILPGKSMALKVIAKQQNENKKLTSIEKPILCDENSLIVFFLINLIVFKRFIKKKEKMR